MSTGSTRAVDTVTAVAHGSCTATVSTRRPMADILAHV
ncbi:hypothetical protein NP493_327g03007 [Ridgeia piscesae]|uniref:Uncharacterized protein n=1 Tax=Ridgeia piscesae TaxID=27915 RepID=A0AAD9L4C5_RIDPI|nr:hypothetical protein NP493_327g03007 [Ridgeia piscesae]